jgi:hypothetical protein
VRRHVVVLVLLAACGTKEPAPPAPGTAPSPVAPGPTAPASGTDTPLPAGDCAALNARFDDVLAHAGGVCHGGPDCACYPGGLGANPTCGGVTDKDTAAKLFAIRDLVARAHCPMPIQCAASICHAICERGRCR